MSRERRHNRSRRRRGRFRALYQTVALLLAAAALFAGSVVFFRVQNVTVSGMSRYTQEQIVAVSRIETDDPLVLLNKESVIRRLRAELPYIESVSIRRALPDTVVITVVETAAAAAVEAGGSWWLIGSSGKLLEQVASPGDRAVLTGVTLTDPAAGQRAVPAEAEAIRFEYALAFLAQLEERGLLEDLTALDCSSADFTADLSGRFTLLFPSTGDFSEYLALFCRAVEEELGENETGLFDFTHYETTGYVYFRQQK